MTEFPRKSSDIPLDRIEKHFNRSPHHEENISYEHYDSKYDGYNQHLSSDEQSFVRRIDLFILPLACTIDFLQFIDKAAISYAGNLDLQTKFAFTDDQLSLLGLIFYLGYLILQFPNIYMVQKIGLGRYIGGMVFVWGAVLTITAACTNYPQMIALRLLLGAAEAGIYPALSLIICTFYRRSEQLARLGVVWMGNGVGLIAGGVLTFAIGSMKNTLNLSQWQWMLIILGSVTSFFGIFSFFCLIDNPKSRALGLNAEQEILIEERNRDNAVVRTNKVNKDHILEALGELRLWGFCLVSLINNLQNGAMSVSLRRLTIEYNLKDEQAWVFSVGAGGSIILFTTMAILIVRKTKQLIYCICFMIVIDVVGLLVFEVSTNPVVRLVGFYLTWSYVAIFTLTVSATANNVSGYTKKIFYNAMIMIFYAIGNAIGPYMVPATGSTFLISSVITCVIACTAMFLILVVVRWRMELINRRRLRNSAVVMTNVEDDLTDVQDPNFIYCL